MVLNFLSQTAGQFQLVRLDSQDSLDANFLTQKSRSISRNLSRPGNLGDSLPVYLDLVQEAILF